MRQRAREKLSLRGPAVTAGAGNRRDSRGSRARRARSWRPHPHSLRRGTRAVPSTCAPGSQGSVPAEPDGDRVTDGGRELLLQRRRALQAAKTAEHGGGAGGAELPVSGRALELAQELLVGLVHRVLWQGGGRRRGRRAAARRGSLRLRADAGKLRGALQEGDV